MTFLLYVENISCCTQNEMNPLRHRLALASLYQFSTPLLSLGFLGSSAEGRIHALYLPWERFLVLASGC